MYIDTLWVLRTGEESPELLVAWDEVTVDGYPEGFEEACERQKNQIGGEAEFRRVTLKISTARVLAAFAPDLIAGEVVGD